MNGNWSAGANVATLVPVDGHRASVTLQHYSGDEIFLGFGELPEAGKGVRLSASMPMVTVTDHRAGMAVMGVCSSGKSAAGGFATA